MSSWWVGRRDGLLAELAGLLVVFGADPVEDPGVGELGDAAAALAGEYRTSGRGEGVREAGALLDQAAAELRAADRFRGTLLPVVVRHLRRAAAFLASACARLGSAAGAVADGPARAAAAW
ncbi:hypothetical protein AB0D08_40565 [Kitasatospora sp. NPDC048540]|uniref:hypothetical protein n=1 Tax=Kitasatospora sp. NPDC048540 TaxID=3155634 RepID=UPI0033ED7B96